VSKSRRTRVFTGDFSIEVQKYGKLMKKWKRPLPFGMFGIARNQTERKRPLAFVRQMNPTKQRGISQTTKRTKENKPVFHDVRSDGKERPWREKKIQSGFLVESFDRQGDGKRAGRIRLCGDCLEFLKQIRELPGLDSETRNKLFHAYFCKDRFCLMCQWRRSLRTAYVLSRIAEYITGNPKKGIQPVCPKLVPLLLTLTVRNCSADAAELSQLLDVILKGWNRLLQVKCVKSAVRGWFRSLEITYNRETNTFHPHIHVLLWVPEKSYFGTCADYIKHSEWLNLWRKSTRDSSITQVDIRRADNDYILELSKYITKNSDFMLDNDTARADMLLSILVKALRKRRFQAFGGIMKEIAAMLNLLDKDGKENLFDIGDVDNEGWRTISVLLVRWFAEYSEYCITKELGLDGN
jgi:plasmid rolling circle replication initiator protein Rep